MKILFIGDIVGRPGRKIVAKLLPELRARHQVDVVIANAENSAGGLGATPEILRELTDQGVHGFTFGNHTWRKKVLIGALEEMQQVVRPANYPPGVPGRGYTILTLPDGRKLGLLNLIGRVYMEAFDCPFRVGAESVELLRTQTNTILVDMHAEATSEKIAMGWHLAGHVSAVVGTHTHVQTGDEWILPGGTAYITDVGMCGPYIGVIGSERHNVLHKFITGMPKKFEVAHGPNIFCGVVIDIDDATGKARSIERVLHREPLQ